MDSQAFERLLYNLRPKLHRFCARMTGSVVDGEDVVQETFVKALEALSAVGTLEHPESWLFRIAHNTALDFLRRRKRLEAHHVDEDPDSAMDPASIQDPTAAATSLRTFMRLPVAQRSSVILMDVLGYSLQEISGVLGTGLPAIKSSLHRGRARLREWAQEPENASPPVLAEPERSLLAQYVDSFSARDFDAVRNMLAEEVRLELVNLARMTGSEVGKYFHNYSGDQHWRAAPGIVDGRPAMLMRDMREARQASVYFVLLKWSNGQVAEIRDFRYARYAVEGAEMFLQN